MKVPIAATCGLSLQSVDQPREIFLEPVGVEAGSVPQHKESARIDQRGGERIRRVCAPRGESLIGIGDERDRPQLFERRSRQRRAGIHQPHAIGILVQREARAMQQIELREALVFATATGNCSLRYSTSGIRALARHREQRPLPARIVPDEGAAIRLLRMRAVHILRRGYQLAEIARAVWPPAGLIERQCDKHRCGENGGDQYQLQAAFCTFIHCNYFRSIE